MSFGKEARSPSTRDRGIGRNCRERSAAGVKTSCILWYELTFPTPRTNGRGEDDLASVMITLEKLTMLVRFLSDLIEKGLLRCENAATTCRECTQSRISPRKTFGGAQYSCLGPQPVPAFQVRDILPSGYSTVHCRLFSHSFLIVSSLFRGLEVSPTLITRLSHPSLPFI